MDKTDSHFSSNKYEKRIILKTETSPLLSFHSRSSPYSRAPLFLWTSLDKCSSHDFALSFSVELLKHLSLRSRSLNLSVEIFEPFSRVPLALSQG